MATKYCDVMFYVSTPNGLIQVGWQLQNLKSQSNIACLLCGDLTNETKKQFKTHLIEKHPEMASYVKLTNFRQMII